MESPGQGFPPARQSRALTDLLVRPTKWEENPGRVAQLVEQRTENPCVAGSIPAPSTVWQCGVEDVCSVRLPAVPPLGLRSKPCRWRPALVGIFPAGRFRLRKSHGSSDHAIVGPHCRKAARRL